MIAKINTIIIIECVWILFFDLFSQWKMCYLIQNWLFARIS